MRGGLAAMMAARSTFVVSAFVLQVGMAYLLGDPKAYGTFGVVLSLITMARVFLASGMPQSLSRSVAQRGDSDTGDLLRAGVRVQAASGVALTLLFAALAPVLVRLLNDRALLPYLLFCAPLIFFMGMHQIYLGYLNGLRRFREQAVLLGLYAVLRVAAGFGLVLVGWGVYGALGGLVLAAAALLALEAGLLGAGTRAATGEGGRLLRFAVPLIGSAFAIAAVQNLDLLLLKRYAADEALVGYYTAAMNLARAPYFLFSAFTMTALPLVANALGRSDESAAGRTVRGHTTLLVLMGAPGLALAAGAPEGILRLLYPADYGAAALPLVMLVASMLLLSAFAMFNAVLAAMGQPYRAMALVGVSIPLQAGLGIVLIPRYGMTGAAAANLTSVAVIAMIAAGMVAWRFGSPVQAKRAFWAVAGGLAAWGATAAVPHATRAGTVLALAVGFAVFACVTFAGDPQAVSALRRLLRSRGVANR